MRRRSSAEVDRTWLAELAEMFEQVVADQAAFLREALLEKEPIWQEA